MAGRKTTKRRTTRRRRKNPAPKRTTRRRRRRNPASIRGFFSGVNLTEPFRQWRPLWVMIGKMAGAFAVRQWGDPELAPGSTATMGGRWTIKNHILNLVAGALAGSVIAQWKGKPQGQLAYDGAVNLSISKAFWHEVIQSIPGGVTYFGNVDPAVQSLLQRAQDGDTIDDGRGNRFVVKALPSGQKQLVPMMGLEQARPLDGLQQARPLDGLTTARPLDGYQQRRFQERMRSEGYAPTGHLTVNDDATSEAAVYLRRGSSDPYSAAFLGGRV